MRWMKDCFPCLLNSTWHIVWWGSGLRMSFKKIMEAVKLGLFLSFTLWFSKSALYSCWWLDVECVLDLWLILICQRIFSVGIQTPTWNFRGFRSAFCVYCSSLLSSPNWFSSFSQENCRDAGFFLLYLNSVIACITSRMQ